MRRLTLWVAGVLFAVFGASVAFAIANPFSWWSGSGTISSTVAFGTAKETASYQFSTGLYIDPNTIDFGSVAPFGTTTSVAMDFETGKTTNSHAAIEKKPETARRERNRALAAELYGLQRVTNPQKVLAHGDLGDATIDAESIKLSGGMTAIKGFTKVKGSVTMKYGGTMTSGPRSGQSFKGKIKITFDGNRM